ncbi:MAG: hypothetical protein LBQ38_05735, partial [Spirochaetaceae bacterium]|nr:hypothetical protein [Spirochaetaceae bacterium]
MAIHFDPSRWEKVRETYEKWWNRELDRPVMNIRVNNVHRPEGEVPRAPLLSQVVCADLSYSAEELVDAIDYHLQSTEFLGDSFPAVNLDSFGPGVLSAFCGARLDNSSGRVWFSVEPRLPIEEIHLSYDPSNQWAKRIKDIYRAGLHKWNGVVLMGMPDLGGVLDVAATFRGSEELLMDLYDSPDEVWRLCGEIQNAWYEAYHDLEAVLQPGNGGYSDWGGAYSAVPSYILQSDFSYMIGPEMFNQFVLPCLKRDCEELDHTIYHLDGVGEIPHLDSLLTLDKLDAVQWVYGDGKPTARHWIDLYRKIAAAGKGIHLVGDGEDLREVYTQIKDNIYFPYTFDAKDLEYARA